MKKTVLSPEALAKVLGTTPEPSAAEVEIPAAVETPETAPVASETAPAVPEEAAKMTAELTAQAAQIADLTKQVEDGKLALESLKVDVAKQAEEAKAAAKPLADIVAGQISQMRTALSLAEVDVTAWTPEALVKEYQAVSESFMKSLPVGSVVPKEEGNQAVKAINSNHDASKIKALGF